ncbi:MAG: dienelactone hydrolase family protein [Candidatus Competibacteraceae bacterium]|nr:dienelactone hydrolase family protein [Candidatus Competibacteraceae bacterium]MCP5126614.1 dienelactone hydrolase family protein [Gammaproteobacteria bacterium]
MRNWIAAMILSLTPFLALGATGKVITYEVNGQPYEGYFINPGKDAPFILMIHDWDGLTDYEVKRANMLAEKGYAVFAADLFGKGVRPTKDVDKRQHTGELYKDREKMRALMMGALETAKANGANIDNAIAMGYCFGGAAVLELARSGANLKGFATFHGGLQTPEGQDYAKTRAPVLIMHGGADTAVTIDDVATLAKELEAANVPYEIAVYSGAPHAFTVFGEERYREDADQKSWALFNRFLEANLK